MTETICLSNCFVFLWTQEGFNSQTPVHRGDTWDVLVSELSRRNGIYFQVRLLIIFHDTLLYLSHTYMQLKAETSEIVKTHNRRSPDLSPCMVKVHSGKTPRWEYHHWALSEWDRDTYCNKVRLCYWCTTQPTLTNTCGIWLDTHCYKTVILNKSGSELGVSVALLWFWAASLLMDGVVFLSS